MSAIAIKTIEHHQDAIAAKRVDDERWANEQTDHIDNAMSAWGNSVTSRMHRHAIKVLENGMRDMHPVLMQGRRMVKAKLIHTKFGTSWMLDDSEQDLIKARGKKFLPTDWNKKNRSRVLKQLGLRQTVRLVKVEPVVFFSCNSIGDAGNVSTKREGQ